MEEAPKPPDTESSPLPSPPKITDAQLSQLPALERYKMMREEVLLYIRETYRTEWITAVAVGAIYTWLELHKMDNSIPWFIWFVPCGIIALSGARCFFFMEELRRIGKYLKKIECDVFGDISAKEFA